MKRLLLIAAVPLLLTSAARAAEEMAYVIKVTPTLAYVDVGRSAGAIEGGMYLILREDGDGYREIGQVQLVRVDANFSIGEIVDVVAGQDLEVLDRVVLKSVWEAMAQMAGESMKPSGRKGRSLVGRRSFQLLVGADFNRHAELRYVFYDGLLRLIDARAGTGLGIGVRLGQALGDQWRANLTYRMGRGQDVTGLAIEADLHLVPRGYDRAGLYFGAGAGMHQLSWDPPSNTDGSANKVGVNLMAGIQAPEVMNLLVEVGYQRVIKFDDVLDVSNMRAYLGFGRSF